MRQFIIEQSAADLTSHTGLGLIGLAVHCHTDLAGLDHRWAQDSVFR